MVVDCACTRERIASKRRVLMRTTRKGFSKALDSIQIRFPCTVNPLLPCQQLRVRRDTQLIINYLWPRINGPSERDSINLISVTLLAIRRHFWEMSRAERMFGKCEGVSELSGCEDNVEQARILGRTNDWFDSFWSDR